MLAKCSILHYFCGKVLLTNSFKPQDLFYFQVCSYRFPDINFLLQTEISRFKTRQQRIYKNFQKNDFICASTDILKRNHRIYWYYVNCQFFLRLAFFSTKLIKFCLSFTQSNNCMESIIIKIKFTRQILLQIHDTTFNLNALLVLNMRG